MSLPTYMIDVKAHALPRVLWLQAWDTYRALDTCFDLLGVRKNNGIIGSPANRDNGPHREFFL